MITFEGVVLRTDGAIDGQGDVFSPESVIELPVRPVPVFSEFDHSRPVGEAELYREDGVVKYKIRLLEAKVSEQMAKALTPCVGGRILEKDGNLIKRAKITELGISISGNSDTRIKKLGEE